MTERTAAEAADWTKGSGSGTVAFFVRPADAVKRMARLVTPDIVLASGNSNSLLISHRQTTSADLYLCFNDSDHALNCTLGIRRSSLVAQRPAWLRLETETGEIGATHGWDDGANACSGAARVGRADVRIGLSRLDWDHVCEPGK